MDLSDLVGAACGGDTPKSPPPVDEAPSASLYKSLVVLSYFSSLVFVFFGVSSRVFRPVLCESAVPLDRPPRAHDK